jgi:MFS family permease
MGKFGLSSARTDLFLVRVSAALLTAGTLLLSVSEISSLAILSLIIFALGNAFTTIGKSLLTTFGPPEMAGTLLSAMNVSASLGAVIAGPIIDVMFDWGLKQGGIWVGAPLFFVTLLYALTLCSVCVLRLPDKSEDDDDDDDDEQNQQRAQGVLGS